MVRSYYLSLSLSIINKLRVFSSSFMNWMRKSILLVNLTLIAIFLFLAFCWLESNLNNICLTEHKLYAVTHHSLWIFWGKFAHNYWHMATENSLCQTLCAICAQHMRFFCVVIFIVRFSKKTFWCSKNVTFLRIKIEVNVKWDQS